MHRRIHKHTHTKTHRHSLTQKHKQIRTYPPVTHNNLKLNLNALKHTKATTNLHKHTQTYKIKPQDT